MKVKLSKTSKPISKPEPFIPNEPLISFMPKLEPHSDRICFHCLKKLGGKCAFIIMHTYLCQKCATSLAQKIADSL